MNQTTTHNETRQKVLVVDNLGDFRLLLSGWLTKRGYQVVEAASGQEAVEVARREAPDLILMDIKMPGGDGIGAAQAIRAHEWLRGVPVVAVSGDNTEYSKTKALGAGFDEYLVKPVRPEELEEVLARFLTTAENVIH